MDRETIPYGKMSVCVPKEGSALALTLIVGSAVVSYEAGPGVLMIDYEGNKHGAVNMKRFFERAWSAAGRAHTRYPTVARSMGRAEEMIVIGSVGADGLMNLDESLPKELKEAAERWMGGSWADAKAGVEEERLAKEMRDPKRLREMFVSGRIPGMKR